MLESLKYISEGNAHIVMQIVGTDSVLRLIKLDDNPVDVDQIVKSVKFINLIMVPLTDNYNYGAGQTVEIPSEYMPELQSELQQLERPLNRLNKSVICQFAIKTPNLAIINQDCRTNFCIEIKPKEGFIASTLAKHSKCYYCLKQYLKLQSKDIEEVSAYCPLDLFSGDRKRMQTAIKNMINNPQNNFKFFIDGNLVFPNKNKKDLPIFLKKVEMDKLFDINVLTTFIVEVLLSKRSSRRTRHTRHTSIQVTEIETSKRSSGPCVDTCELAQHSMLFKLLQLQKLSETMNLKNAYITEQHMDYVASLIHHVRTLKLDLKEEKDRETFMKSASLTHLAMISAIAKDCSIMIAFTKEHVKDTPYIDVKHGNNGNSTTRLYYKLTLTDLEAKPIATLFKRKYTEQKILELYEKHLQAQNMESE